MEVKAMRYGGVEMPDVRGVKGSVVRLLRDWHVEGMLPDGRIFYVDVHAGFEFDGASIPRALWRLCGHPLEAPRIAAALAHDWLYGAHVCSRADADLIYRTVSRMVGIGAFCSGVEYSVLWLFGWIAWIRKRTDEKCFALTHGALELENKKGNTK